MDVYEDMRFGIELETLMLDQGKRKRSYKETWKANVKKLSSALGRAGLGNHIASAERKHEELFQEWYIAEDATIGDHHHCRYGIELVSPILQHSAHAHWSAQLTQLFQVLAQPAFNCRPESDCATHIHISLASGWSTDSLKSLAQAIIFYGPEFELLANRLGRSGNVHAKPNHKNPACLGGYQNLDAIIARIETLETHEQIVQLLCSHDTRNRGRNYYWNLWPVTGKLGRHNAVVYPQTGTVEFRLPPGSRDGREARMWVDFVHLFVFAALTAPQP
ncbi:putative amidoligase [Xylariomycetidae sp. FL2044]|nr:putative amidoligase [Xylariomycetidae sp. FL2044]